jgi:hypothetical protein
MIPAEISECCSLGLFGYPLRDNFSEIMEEQAEDIKRCLTSSLEKFQGKIDENASLWELITKID